MANEKCNIQDLAGFLAVRNRCPRSKADTFLRKMLAVIKAGLEADDFVKVKGVGTFKLVTVNSRTSVDVNTGERIEISEHQRLLFTPDAAMKVRVNRPFEKFETISLDDDVDVQSLQTDTGEQPEVEQKTKPAVEKKVVPETVEPEEEQPEEAVEAEEEMEEETPEPAEAQPEEEKEETPATTDGELQATSLFIGEDAGEPDKTAQEEEGDNEPPATEKDGETELEERAEEDMEPEKKSVWRKLLLITAAGVAAVLLVALGYVAGSRHWLDSQPEMAGQMTYTAVKKTPEKKAQKAVTPPAQKQQVEMAPPKIKEPTPEEQSSKYEQLPGDFLIAGTRETHRMGETDNLARLSLRYYGRKNCVKYIVFYNDVKNPDVIPLGQELKIPRLLHKDSGKELKKAKE